MASAHVKTIVLGPEYDARLREVLKHVFLRLGGKGLGSEWSVVGSQELERVEVEVRGERLVIEAETYVGLSITGPAQLVDEVRELVKEQLSSE